MSGMTSRDRLDTAVVIVDQARRNPDPGAAAAEAERGLTALLTDQADVTVAA
jgi:hypothetical protein